MSRHYRGRRERAGEYERQHSGRSGGWGVGLYRNTRKGWIAGVCAGLADHWDIAPWVMRLAWLGAFLFTNTLALWAYLAAWLLLAPRPANGARDAGPEVAMEYDERYHGYRPRRVFHYPEAPGVRLDRARERLDDALRRVEDMESYVTSRRFRLNEEFSRL